MDPTFDPFLRDPRGAEVALDASSIRRAVAVLTHREVMVGTEQGELLVARLVKPLGLRFDGSAPVRTGEEVALSDHRGLQYVGLRATVSGVLDEARGSVARIFEPHAAWFFPGRRHVRVDGALGAEVTLEGASAAAAVRGVDVSMGGIGLVVDAVDQRAVGDVVTLALRFEDGVVRVQARVRVTAPAGREVRLGLEFASPSEEVARRIQVALSRLRADP